MASNRVGSVFLGDIQRHRVLSSSSASHGSASPPSSPPPTGSGPGANSIASVFSLAQGQLASPTTFESPEEGAEESEEESEESEEEDEEDDMDSIPEKNGEQEIEKLPAPIPKHVDPVLALELRLRWLRALVLGQGNYNAKGKGKEGASSAIPNSSYNSNTGDTLTRLTESVRKDLQKVVEGNEGLRRFIDSYDKYHSLLTPSFLLSGFLPESSSEGDTYVPTYDKLSPEEINALLGEMESDIRSADRDMQEIVSLERKGVTGAGRLPDYESLEPRLQALIQAQEEDAKLAASLELRISSFVERHATYIDTLSELFVAWDDTLTDTEDKVAKMERDIAERRRLGLVA